MIHIGRLALAFVLTLISCAAIAQLSPQIRITGTISGTDPIGLGFLRVNFSCAGTPTCVGLYTVTERNGGCSNSFTFTDSLSISGLDLSKPGPLQGTITSIGANHSHNSDGTCTYTTVQRAGLNPYTGTWDGTSGTISVNGTDEVGKPFVIPGTFTAAFPAAPPVFPMTVTQNITPTTATASAQIQPRPQDVGTTASVYVFAHAPASAVGKGAAKQIDGAAIPAQNLDDYCVLVQLDASGKMVAVLAAALQAYTTGVLSAQGQSVNILNNIPTASVAGAAFYVGYGATSAAMFANGLYQAAVSVPGSSQCTASLTSAPAPNSPGGLTGLWWNPGESGWGVHFTQRRNVVFAAWYTYDATGKPKWYVASSCALPSGNTGTSGTCSGTLYEVNGPVFFGATFNPNAVNVLTAGTLQVNFQNANAASMTYTIGTQTRTVALTRQVFASGTTTPAVDYTDLWWNSTESGWGVAVSHQFGVMFLAWYVYDATGKPVWYVASNCALSGSLCLGTLYRTTGPALGPTFDPSRVQVFTAGTVNVIFTDANTGLLTYTVDGVTASKPIKRQAF